MSADRASQGGTVSPEDADRLSEKFKPSWEVDEPAGPPQPPVAPSAPLAAAPAAAATAPQAPSSPASPGGKAPPRHLAATMVGMGSPLAAPAQPAPAPAPPAPNPAAQSAAGAGVTPNEFAIAVPPTRPSQPAIPKPVLPAVVIADGASATVPDTAAKPSGSDVESAASAALGARLAPPPAVDLGDETVQLYGLKKSGGTGIFIGVGVAVVAAVGLWFATQKSDKPAAVVAPASTPIKAAAEPIPPPPPATPEPVAAPPPTPKAVAAAPAPTAETKPAATPEPPPVAKPASLAAAPPPAANPPPAKTREAAPPPVAKPAPPPPPAPKPAAHKPAPPPATPTPGKPGGIVREVPF